MQNSGLGNAVNPILSLADPAVYGIPMVLLIGWRGKPGETDEPQHKKQGEVTEALLNDMGIPIAYLPIDPDTSSHTLRLAFKQSLEVNGPVAILVSKNSFQPKPKTASSNSALNSGLMSREQALAIVYSQVKGDDAVISTTGMLSRELEELQRSRSRELQPATLFVIGGMGHASSIALGITQAKPLTKVWCLDGDGAMLMHLGAVPVIASVSPSNLTHVVFDNESHDSVGGQRTPLYNSDLVGIAMASGYSQASVATSEREILDKLEELSLTSGPRLLQIKVRKGNRPDLGRPKQTPGEMKTALMSKLNSNA
jgi:phosphonopyruvate decarboxylase